VELAAARQRLAGAVAAGGRGGALDPALREVAHAEGLLPLLERAGALDPLGLPAAAALELARRAALVRLLERFAGARIRVLVIKGAHLAYAVYPDPSLRPRSDADLFIDEADAAAAQRVLRESGHALVPHVTGRFVMSQFHFVDAGPSGAHAYDVHWRLANPLAFRHVLPFADVWRDSVAVPALGARARGPSLPHALLIACVHRAAHHAAADRLLWLYDVRLLLRAAGPAEIEIFCTLADRWGVHAVCADACAAAAAWFGDAQVPPRLADRAGHAEEPTAAYLRGRMGPAAQLWHDVRALTGWRDRATLVREHVFPPVEYMRQTQGSGPLPWLYTRRMTRGALRWLGRGQTRAADQHRPRTHTD
jgi:hypothetical protein